MPWITRGIRNGIVTTRYPRRRDGYGASFRATVSVRERRPAAVMSPLEALGDITARCPTQAISTAEPGIRLDRGRCIVCGRCVEDRPDTFDFAPDIEVAALHRALLVVPTAGTDEGLDVVRDELRRRVRALRRSIYIRHVDCGSDGSEEWEIAALTNPIYDVQRLGIFFTASPRHADLLLVTGAGSVAMIGPLRQTLDSIPEPRVVVAVGTDAISGGLFAGSYATRDGIHGEVDVDVLVPGSPPSPFSILHGILLGIGLLPPPGSGER